MTKTAELLEFIRTHGQVRPKEAAAAGFQQSLLHHLLERGDIERVARGLYQLPGAMTSEHESLVEVAHLVPHGVIPLFREGLGERRFTPVEVERFARTPRVWNVMKPYIQGMTA